MKKLRIITANRILLLIVFIAAQIDAVMAQSNTVSENRYQIFFSKPWVWGVIILIAGLIVFAVKDRSKSNRDYKTTE